MRIRLKLQLPLLAILSLLLLILALLHYFWLPNIDEKAFRQLEVETLEQMHIVAKDIATPLGAGNIALIQDDLRQVQRRHPHWIQVTLRNGDGVRLYPVLSLPGEATDHADIHQFGTARAFRQSLHMTMPIVGADKQRIGYLQVSVDDHFLEERERAVVLETIIALALVMLAMLLIGAFVLDRWITRPLQLLVNATHRLAAGSYDTELPIRSQDEIGQLGTSFERMRQKVQRREQSLIQSRTEAERLRDTYAALSSLNAFIAERPEPEDLLRRAGDIIHQTLRPEFLWIAQIDWQILGLRCQLVVPEPADAESRLHIDQAIAAIRIDTSAETNVFQRLLLSAEVQCIRDISQETALGDWHPILDDSSASSMAVAPIMMHSRVTAIVALFTRDPAMCEPTGLKLLGELAERVGLSLEDHAKDQELQLHALYDPMTRLPNRTLFMSRLTELRAKTTTHKQVAQYAVGILDLKGLKAVNDRLGHNSGDHVVHEVAQRLEGFRHGDDLVARLSGDEFGLILFARPGKGDWESPLNRLLEVLDTAFVLPEGEVVNLKAHIGLARSPADGRHPESLLRRADLALHEAKSSEESSYCFFSSPLEEQMLNRHRVQREFLDCIRSNHLVLHYQPQMNIATCREIGYEALIRWPLADGGFRPAYEFIALVEADGRLIRSLGRYVLKQALTQLSTWQAAGYETTVSVNIGARHLLAPEFLQDLDAALSEHASVRHALKLEITETAYMADLGRTAEVLAACQARGLKVALDDFGTGYASLSYLQRLPCNQIKIDQSFVRQLLDTPQNQAIVAGLITAARLLELEIVAEGVETTEHALRLLEMGCLVSQGYAAARPMPAEDVIPWSRRQRPNHSLPSWIHQGASAREFRLMAIAAEHHLSGCAACVHSGDIAFSDVSVAGTRRVCRFNAWYTGDGLKQYGTHPDYEALGAAHRYLHDTETWACNLCRNNGYDGDPTVVNNRLREAQIGFFNLFWAIISLAETRETTSATDVDALTSRLESR